MHSCPKRRDRFQPLRRIATGASSLFRSPPGERSISRRSPASPGSPLSSSVLANERFPNPPGGSQHFRSQSSSPPTPNSSARRRVVVDPHGVPRPVFFLGAGAPSTRRRTPDLQGFTIDFSVGRRDARKTLRRTTHGQTSISTLGEQLEYLRARPRRGVRKPAPRRLRGRRRRTTSALFCDRADARRRRATRRSSKTQRGSSWPNGRCRWLTGEQSSSPRSQPHLRRAAIEQTKQRTWSGSTARSSRGAPAGRPPRRSAFLYGK